MMVENLDFFFFFIYKLDSSYIVRHQCIHAEANISKPSPRKREKEKKKRGKE